MPPVINVEVSHNLKRASSEVSESVQSGFDFKMVLASLGVIAMITLASCVALRARKRRQSQEESVEYLILESEVEIEIGDESVEIEYEDEDINGRMSLETVLKSAPAHRLAFDINKLPVLHIDRKMGNILERRGKKTLKLSGPESGEADMAFVDIKDGKLTLSPFSSRKEGFQTIPDFPITRKRTPKKLDLCDVRLPFEIATAPQMMEHSWRPLDTPELPVRLV